MEMLDNISGAIPGDEKVYLFLDNASFHRSKETAAHMKLRNIEPVYNVSYKFIYNPCERLFGQYKQHFRRVLLGKMLAGAGVKENPLKAALFETFCAKENLVKQSIPRFIKKALGMLRREANEIRAHYGEEKLKDVE